MTPTLVKHNTHKNDGFDRLKSLLFSFAPSPSVSQYTNAFAIAQLCGVLCAPWNGIIMDRHKGKPLDPGNSTLLLQVAPVLSAAARARLPLQERRSRRPTCAPPASPSSSPPCRACSSQSAPRFLSSRCSTSPLSYKSSTAPSSTEGMQRSSALCEQPPHACTYTHAQAVYFNLSGEENSCVLCLDFSFPACHFGKLYGLAKSISAVVSLLQYPCFTLVTGALHGDPFYVGTIVQNQCIEHVFHQIRVYTNSSQCFFLTPTLFLVYHN